MLRHILVITIGVAAISTAHAAVLSQKATVSGSGAPDYTLAYLDFAGFDTSLGTLNSITINGQLSVQETLTYSSASSTSSTVPVTLSFSLGVANQGFVNTSQNTVGAATYPPDGSEVIRVSGSASLSDALSAAFVSSVANGNGFSGQIGTSVTSPGFPSNVNGTVMATASALYDYTPASVPEPSSLALATMIGVIPPLVRRRKRD